MNDWSFSYNWVSLQDAKLKLRGRIDTIHHVRCVDSTFLCPL